MVLETWQRGEERKREEREEPDIRILCGSICILWYGTLRVLKWSTKPDVEVVDIFGGYILIHALERISTCHYPFL